MNIRSLYNPIGRKKKRYKKILELLEVKKKDRILNIGSGKGYTFEIFNKENPIIGIDIFPEKDNQIKQKNFQYIQRTRDKLAFKDKEFDVVVSIRVLEHIQPEPSFQKTCTEIQRVGKSYAVVVPSFMTLIEPHYAFPFFQHFSTNVQKKLNKFFKLKYTEEGQDSREFEKIRYLKKSQWQKLFPKAKIKTHMHIGPFITNYIIWENHKG